MVLAFSVLPASAQITPDGSLPTNITSPDGLNFTIDNGSLSGSNLFHSFSEFSVPTNGSAFFNNGLDVQNIFSRVTGGNISNIDGLLRANGGANLFLLNPAGIVFGPNASLNLGGSFFGTTANSIKFADGVKFSATNPTETPLLTISVPVGLQMGLNPGGITVQGSGHRLRGDIFTILDRSDHPSGLQVGAGNTLALIGGEVNFSGGIAVVADGGHLEVSGVSDGQVQLTPHGQEWVGDYSGVQQFNDIHLAEQSLIDASGDGGSIQIRGRNIDFTEGSAATIQNIEEQPFMGITVHATESLNLTGNTADGRLGSMLRIENLGTGQTGDITVSAGQLSMQDGAGIWNSTFTEAVGGHIAISVPGLIEVNGVVPTNPTVLSSIVTFALNSGNAGDITISTGNLRFINSGNLISTTIGTGQAGTVRIDAADLIEIAGNNPVTLGSSAMVSSTLGRGNASDLFINTSRLVVREGGLLGSSALATGSAGSVTINASESVVVGGRASGSILPSRIASFAEKTEPAFQATYGLPAVPSGDSGSLTINTPSLHIIDGASVTVKNDGPGRAGDLQINTDSIVLDDQGSINASTASGNGGNVRLNLQDTLLLRQNSQISANAGANGNGGNLSISVPTIVGLENSDIIANAVRGNGGNIQINTQGIFGLENRPQLTPESDITASSQFGVSGNISINNPEVDPSASLVNFSQKVVDPNEQVVSGCQWTADSEFVATGRSGVPANPNRPLASSRSWSDVRDLSAFRGETVQAASVPIETPKPLIEATGWVVREDGTVELVATANPPQSGSFAASNCDPFRHPEAAN